ncbi:hypothetical protein A0H81_03491 [Grifola frondosa]|uniref:Acyl-CoA thioesterase-like N-terminal HotDog domain-containing protein n=1 Tax=Grifola frondosa TaxID=5627 RepID=A0A1C7MI46_GRIFR|nr:hypothetical protein A0H81_03491 [Grifola frondosa]
MVFCIRDEGRKVEKEADEGEEQREEAFVSGDSIRSDALSKSYPVLSLDHVLVLHHGPALQALAVIADPSRSTSGKDSVSVYSAAIDPEWVILQAPQGGEEPRHTYPRYLKLVTRSSRRIQPRHHPRSRHSAPVRLEAPRPIHLTVHFLRIPRLATLHVHVRVLKIGRDFTNLLADLVQNVSLSCFALLMLRTHLTSPHLTGDSDDHDTHDVRRTRPAPLHTARPHPRPSPPKGPPHAHADAPLQVLLGPRHALLGHEQAHPRRARPRVRRAEQVRCGGHAVGHVLYAPDGAGPAAAVDDSVSCGLGDGARREHGRVRRGGPQMFPIPPASSPDHSPRTVALFSTGAFANDPQARHDTRVEVWTAPSDIGEGEERVGWREMQRCLAVMNTVMVVVPAAVNINAGAKGGKL